MLDNIDFHPSVMAPVPDRAIVRRLKEHDPHLNVGWHSKRKRWVILGRNQMKWDGGDVHIMTVQNQDGSFRPLDDRVIVNIKLADAFRYDDIHHFRKILDENDRAVDQKMSRAMSDAFRDRNEDLYRAYFGSPSVAPAGGWRIGDA